jgi:hypothetical protein
VGPIRGSHEGCPPRWGHKSSYTRGVTQEGFTKWGPRTGAPKGVPRRGGRPVEVALGVSPRGCRTKVPEVGSKRGFRGVKPAEYNWGSQMVDPRISRKECRTVRSHNGGPPGWGRRGTYNGRPPTGFTKRSPDGEFPQGGPKRVEPEGGTPRGFPYGVPQAVSPKGGPQEWYQKRVLQRGSA